MANDQSRTEQKTPEATRANVHAWISSLSENEKKMLQTKAHSPKEFAAVAQKIMDIRLADAKRNNNARRDLGEEQLTLLKQQLEHDPNSFMAMVAKTFGLKQEAAAKTAEEQQQRENVILRALDGIKKLTQLALKPLEQMIPTPLKNLFNDPKQQLAQQSQMKPQQPQTGNKEQLAANQQRQQQQNERTQQVADKEEVTKETRMRNARQVRNEKIAQMEKQNRAPRARGGKRAASMDAAPQPATPEAESEYAALASLPQDVAQEARTIGNIQATLAADGHNVVAAPNTPTRNTQNVAKTPSGGGSMTA